MAQVARAEMVDDVIRDLNRHSAVVLAGRPDASHASDPAGAAMAAALAAAGGNGGDGAAAQVEAELELIQREVSGALFMAASFSLSAAANLQ